MSASLVLRSGRVKSGTARFSIGAGAPSRLETRGESLEEVMQRCADHGMAEHRMKGFGPELYSKMRRYVKMVEEA
jgi:predicted small metal-binding protein